jgi:hypothetical protein
MITLIIAQFATRLAHFGREAIAIWQEARELRRQMSGQAEE